MARDDIPPRIGFLMLIAFIITILFVMTCTAVWKHNFREGTLFLIAGAALTYLFFRRRLLALISIALGTVFALAGMGAISHPSTLGILLTLGAAAAAYLFVVWEVKRHPERALGDWKTLFDNNPKQ